MSVSRTRLFADELVHDFMPELDTAAKQDAERRLAQRLANWSPRSQIEYGWLANEADVAAVGVNQIIADCEDTDDPRELTAAYLRGFFVRVVEHHSTD